MRKRRLQAASVYTFFLATFSFFAFILVVTSVSLAQDQLCNRHVNSLNGLQIDCTFCHDIPFPDYLKDGLTLANTAVCNSCHSPDGQYNGVDHAVIGAKANWDSGGVYEGNVLKKEKEKWCVGCHDGGTSVIGDVAAANVAGISITGNWANPGSVFYANISNAANLLDGDISTGCTAGEIIFDLGDTLQVTHLRIFMVSPETVDVTSIYWDVYGGNDLSNWTKIVLGQGVLFTAPRWATEAGKLGSWNEIRLDRFQAVQYLKLVKISPWPVGSTVLREFEFKKDLQYGYYATGHRMSCTQCHDIQKPHIDGEARTYQHASNPYNPQDLQNYQNGYRLKSVDINGITYPPLEVPRSGTNWAEYPRTDHDFALCFTCHDKYSLLGDASSSAEFYKSTLETNFWNEFSLDVNENIRNQHLVHLQGRGPFGNALDWDSDWDGTPDSPQSCTACHNVHGTPAPAMVRHGELISTPEWNKTPSLNLYYLNELAFRDEGTNLLESIGGITQFWGPGPGNPAKNGICNMCHPDRLTYLRTAVEVVSCVSCHSRPFGDRRQVTGENGDFVLPSHHVTDGSMNQVVQDQDCKACHDQTYHTEGTIRLRDADGAASHQYDPDTPFTAEKACLSCHDSEPVPEVPFSDGVIVPDIERVTFWIDSAHATGGRGMVSLSCLGDGLSTGCHDNAHGSNKPSLLAPGQTSDPIEEGICYACHNGQMVTRDMQVPFQKEYRHPIERIGLHLSDESGPDLGPDNRHAECLDCHDPHSAGAAVHTPAGNEIAGDSVLKGTWGVEPVVDPDTPPEPGQQIYQFVELKAPTYPNGSTKEYQICFKCHSYYALGYADHGVTGIIGPSGANITDQAMEFSPANRAAHPVVMETSAQPGANEPKGLEPIQLKDPWKAQAGNQTMYCSDCHGTDAAGFSDAQGPHGSSHKFMLKDPSGGTRVYWPERPDGKLWTLLDIRANFHDWQNKLFCAICHPFLDGPNFVNNAHQKGPHHSQKYVVQGVEYDGAPCVMCHTAVPHGTAVSRLIAYRTDVSPYNYGDMAVMTEFSKAGRTSYVKRSCSIPDALWGCHALGYDVPKYQMAVVGDSGASNPPRLENDPPEVNTPSIEITGEVSYLGIFSGVSAYDPDGSIARYQWNFGDGSTAEGILAAHTYRMAGMYPVTLTVTDNEGAESTDTIATITINPPNQLPVAEAGLDQTVPVSQTVSFSGSGSHDPDGTITHYLWHFGDGMTAEGEDTSHVYDTEGTYQVLLTVTDNSGAHDTDMVVITVNLP
ncbi:MAG: PKD domain-containing protein [bacterium]